VTGKDPEQMTLSLEVMPPEVELEQIHQVGVGYSIAPLLAHFAIAWRPKILLKIYLVAG